MLQFYLDYETCGHDHNSRGVSAVISLVTGYATCLGLIIHIISCPWYYTKTILFQDVIVQTKVCGFSVNTYLNTYVVYVIVVLCFLLARVGTWLGSCRSVLLPSVI